MAALVSQGKLAPAVREKAKSLVRGLAQKDEMGEVIRIHAWVRDHIRYIKDIRGVETLHTPEFMLKTLQGDCDDKSVAVAALLESIGYRTQMVAIGRRRGTYSHVYPEVWVGGRWFGLECTENWPAGKVATQADGWLARMVQPVPI